MLKAFNQIAEPFELLHVGPVENLLLPNEKFFTNFDGVEQSERRKFHSLSSVFGLALREEGLATMQPEAVTCGSRLVCTERTGGEELKVIISDKDVISVVPAKNVNAYSNSLCSQTNSAKADCGRRQRLGDRKRDKISGVGGARCYSIEIAAVFEATVKSTSRGGK